MKILLFVICILPFRSSSQSEIKAIINFRQDTLRAADLWQFEVSIANLSGLPKKVFPLTSENGRILFGEVVLEIKKPQDSTWITTNWIRNMHWEAKYGPSILINLEPNKIITTGDFFCIPVILSPGLYQYRVSYMLCTEYDTSCKIRSEPKNIYVKEYLGEDLNAFEYLSTLSYPLFFYSSIYNLGGEVTYLQQAQQLIREYPNSSFAPYAELYLAQAFELMSNLNAKIDKNASIEYIRLSKKYALAAYKSKNPLIVPIAKSLLANYLSYISQEIFPEGPPVEIENEFRFENKN